MFAKLSSFVQICAKQTNLIRAFSNVQSKPVASIDKDIENDRKSSSNKKIKAEMLTQVLNIQKSQAIQILSKSSKFLKVTSKCIDENHKLCLSNGITSATLQKHPDILAETDLADKIELIKQLPYELDTTAPILRTRTMRLGKFIIEEDAPKRIRFLSNFFNVTEKEACEWISKREFLITLKEEQIKDIVDMLSEFGVSKHEITKDFWVLKYSTATVKSRLTTARKHNIEKVKTWMVRAKPAIFENYLRRKSEDRSILGDNSLIEYLSTKLECDEKTAKNIVQKQPAIQHKSLKKLNSNIDFLLANGFNSAHICKTPKILVHSVETIKKRLHELQAIGMQLDFLSVLTKSQKQYTLFYESLKASKTKNKSSADDK